MNRRRKSELRVAALRVAYQLLENYRSAWQIADHWEGAELQEVLSVLNQEVQRAFDRWKIERLQQQIDRICSGDVVTFERSPGHAFTCQPAEGKYGPVRFYEDEIARLRASGAKWRQLADELAITPLDDDTLECNWCLGVNEHKADCDYDAALKQEDGDG